MSIRAVYWHEGMFLRPHHFQAAHRYWAYQLATSARWDHHYNWGLREIDLDAEALANYRFVVHSLKARLRDGTLIAIPEERTLPALDLRPAFEKSDRVTVYLAIPLQQLGRANVATTAGTDTARYQLDTQMLEDANTGVNPQPVEFLSLNVRLLLSQEDSSGYELLPIARVEKSARAEATPELDVNYIPPLLSCDTWRPLQVDILQTIYDRMGKKIDLIATQLVSRGIALDSQTPGDVILISQLRELNEAYAALGVLVFSQGVHPWLAYMELVRIVGQLAIFGATRRPPELPRYDHDDLAACFYAVKKYIDAYLNLVIEPEYRSRDFVGAGLRMQVQLESAWLEPTWQMFIGVQTVQSQLTTDECIRILTRPGYLDMKVGSSERVDDIFRLGQAGLKFSHSQRPPRALPVAPGLIYFQISREANPEEWQNVQRTLSLAIRLNENLIQGSIQGQKVLTIKALGRTTTLQFTLYLVPTGSS
ncbi:MAG: type VI secretion system baseplate subunit TssK [Gemmataceae bacterium]